MHKPQISVVRGWVGDHKRIVVTLFTEDPDRLDTSHARRMGAVAGHYARDYGNSLAMKCTAQRVDKPELMHDDESGYTAWTVTYDLVTEHLPMEKMFSQMRANDAKRTAHSTECAQCPH